jgi:hypothetical protein
MLAREIPIDVRTFFPYGALAERLERKFSDKSKERVPNTSIANAKGTAS